MVYTDLDAAAIFVLSSAVVGIAAVSVPPSSSLEEDDKELDILVDAESESELPPFILQQRGKYEIKHTRTTTSVTMGTHRHKLARALALMQKFPWCRIKLTTSSFSLFLTLPPSPLSSSLSPWSLTPAPSLRCAFSS